MKRSAYLINVARGRVINTNALLESLKNQDISGAALDVYEATPLPPGSALFDFNEVLLTPHVAAMTEDSMRIMAWEAAVQVLDALQGKYPKNRSEEHTSELQSLMRNSYAVFCLKKKTISYVSTASIVTANI